MLGMSLDNFEPSCFQEETWLHPKGSESRRQSKKRALLMIDLFLKPHHFPANLITIFFSMPDSWFFEGTVLVGLRA